MKFFKNILTFGGRKGNFLLEEKDSNELLLLHKKNFEEMSDQEKDQFLTLSAKDFSKKFKKTIRTLAHE